MVKDLTRKSLEPDDVVNDAIEDDKDYRLGEFICGNKSYPIAEAESSMSGRSRIMLTTGDWFELTVYIEPGEMGIIVRFEDTIAYKCDGDSAMESIMNDLDSRILENRGKKMLKIAENANNVDLESFFE